MSVDQTLALNVKPVDFDYGKVLQQAGTIQGMQTQNQLRELQLAGAQRDEGALQAYAQSQNLDDLRATPELYAKAQAIKGTEDTQRRAKEEENRQLNARAAMRVAGLQGDARSSAWNEELDKAVKEGRLPPLMHGTLKEQGPRDDILNNIIAQGGPIPEPKYGVIGQDLGESQYGWTDPLRRTTTGPQGQPTSDPGSVAPSNRRSSLTGTPYLEAVANDPRYGPSVVNKLKAIGEYREPPPTMRDPTSRQLSLMLDKAYPDYSAAQYPARANWIKELDSGKASSPGGNLIALGTALGHMDTLDKRISDLHNNVNVLPGSDLARRYIGNPIARNMGTDISDFDSREKRFEATKDAVMDEVSKVFAGSGGSTLADREKWADKIQGAKSEKTLKGVVNELAELLHSRVKEVAEQHNRVMGTNLSEFDPRFMSPATAAKMKRRLGIKDDGGDKADHGPLTGSSNALTRITGQTQEEQDAQREKIGVGERYIGPDGQVRTKR